jgi:hypothetical protein
MANRHREAVASRAVDRCEYCHLRAEYSQLRFVCDHIISRKHGGSDEPDNLAYSCPHCNSHKLDNIAGLDSPSRDPVRLFNPRSDIWSEHFRWDGAQLVGLTAVGRTTVRVLAVNIFERLRTRRILMAEGIGFD